MFGTVIRTPANLGALIRDRRHGLGFDQAELAKRVGVSRLWINQIELGKPGASVGLVPRTLMVLGIELTPVDAPVATMTPDINAIIEGARDRRQP
jgi:HTH-type transcriptional regulator/antitoxin HipB